MNFASDKTYLSKNKLQSVNNLSIKVYKDDNVFDRVIEDQKFPSNKNDYDRHRDRSSSVARIRDVSLDKPYSDLEDYPKITNNCKLQNLQKNLTSISEEKSYEKTVIKRPSNPFNNNYFPSTNFISPQNRMNDGFVRGPRINFSINNNNNNNVKDISKNPILPKKSLQDIINNSIIFPNQVRQPINNYSHRQILNPQIRPFRPLLSSENSSLKNFPEPSPKNIANNNIFSKPINFPIQPSNQINLVNSIHSTNSNQNKVFDLNPAFNQSQFNKNNYNNINQQPVRWSGIKDVKVAQFDKKLINPNNDLMRKSEKYQSQTNNNNQPLNTESNNIVSTSNEMSISQLIGSQIYEREIDTNVLKIDFLFMKEQIKCATGNPYFCKKCEAIFNVYSILENGINDKKLWICEFCGNKNELLIDQEELPKQEIIDYYIKSEVQEAVLDPVTIFCFDTSSSMCLTEKIEGEHNFKGKSNINYDEYLSEEGIQTDLYELEYGLENETYVSRLQCLQSAIEENMKTFLSEHPDRKIGFVQFNDEVIGIGDGTENLVKINGNDLNDFEKIVESGEQNSDIISQSIEKSMDSLTEILYDINENGQTALGPAILFSISLIKNNSPGSKIFLLTDGLANIGLGSLDKIDSCEDFNETTQFYEKLGKMAKKKGIVINLITFVDAECKITILNHLCELSGGMIIRVKITDIINKFSDIFNKETSATDVKLTIKLHRLLKFREEDPKLLKHDGSTLVKDLGNVNPDKEICIEYGFKPSQEIVGRYSEININHLEEVLFQTIIEYTNTFGRRLMRVITKKQKISSDKEEVSKISNCSILSLNAMQKSSLIAKEGDYRKAQAEVVAWKGFIKNSSMNSESSKKDFKLFNQNMKEFNDSLQKIQLEERKSGISQNNIQNNSMRIMNRDDELSSKIYQLSNLSVYKECFKK
jgi:hypothetical protein